MRKVHYVTDACFFEGTDCGLGVGRKKTTGDINRVTCSDCIISNLSRRVDTLAKTITTLNATPVPAVVRTVHLTHTSRTHGATVCGFGGIGKDHLTPFVSGATCINCVRRHYQEKNRESMTQIESNTMIAASLFLNRADWERQRMRNLRGEMIRLKDSNELGLSLEVLLDEYLELAHKHDAVIPNHVQALDDARQKFLDSVDRSPTVNAHFWMTGKNLPFCQMYKQVLPTRDNIAGEWGPKVDFICEECLTLTGVTAHTVRQHLLMIKVHRC